MPRATGSAIRRKSGTHSSIAATLPGTVGCDVESTWSKKNSTASLAPSIIAWSRGRSLRARSSGSTFLPSLAVSDAIFAGSSASTNSRTTFSVAARPAGSASSISTTSCAKRLSSLTCSAVIAVPCGATA